MSLFLHLPHAAERVRLRRLRVSDFRGFHTYRGDPEVARYQGWETTTEAETEAMLRDLARNASGLEPGEWVQIGIALQDGDRLIGDLGVWLSPDVRTAEFGVSLAKSAQGQGHAREAAAALIALLFAHTPVQRVIASSDARNAPCLRLLERLGMRHVDTAGAECKGETCTEHVYAIERGNPLP